MPWLGSEDPCSLLAFCPPFSHQTNTGSGTKGTFTQSSESSSIFHILCLPLPARGATPGPHMLDALLLPGCLILALTKHSVKVKLTAFHTVRFWHCPGTSEHTLKQLSISSKQIQGFASAYQLVSLSAFQPDTTQVFPQYKAWQLQDLQVSSWLEHPRTSTDKDLLEFRDHTGWQETFTMDLGGSK